MARTFQITSVFPDLSALENVQVALLAHARRSWSVWPRARALGAERAQELLALVGLAASAAKPAGTLSHGDQKRLELAIALAGEPRLLLLDEPTAGMAAQERLEAIRLVHRVARELGLSCVFTEHDMAVVFAVATRITVMHQGRVLAEGTPTEVRARPEVQQVYLGEDGMNFEPILEHGLLRESVRRFFERELPEARIRDMDRTRRIPRSLWKRFAEMSWMGLSVPTEFGGSGADVATAAVFCEELARRFPSLATDWLLVSMTARVLREFATPRAARPSFSRGSPPAIF